MALDEFAEELAEVIEDRITQGQTKLKFWGGVQGLAQRLGTDLQNGISQQEIDSVFEERKTKYGVNQFPSRAPSSFFELFFDALQDRTLIILMVAALVSIVLGVAVEGESHGWIEGTAIIAAVLLVASVTAGNDYSKEKQFRKLNEISENKFIKVVRAGNQTLASIFDILVGDVVILETGDKICADGLLIEADDLKCNESSMTGESDDIKKSVLTDPWLLCGTQVLEGRGKMLVIAVGPLSQWGRIKALVVKESEATPLQSHLEDLAETIGKMGLVAAIFTFITLVVQWLVKKQSATDFSVADLSDFVEFIITAITIVVVAVPEGLPLAVTISLAYSMFRMMKDNNLVRHLEACETMGGATTICSDKTGTLTENKMAVVKSWIGLKEFSGIPEGLDKSVLGRLAEGVAVNSTAYIVKKEGGVDYVGSKTECALLEYVEKTGFEYAKLRKTTPVKKMFPFNSANKRMSSILERGSNGKCVIFTKGASEMVLELCTTALDHSGKLVPIAQVKDFANKIITDMASNGLRTIALAYGEVNDQQSWTEAPDRNLTLIGICGIKDPVRKEVPAAVKACQEAGISVRMLTGDNILTATQIARECGILTPDGIAIEGPNFRLLSTTEMDKILPRLQVMARCSPIDKYRLVKRLRELGEVVAVTGDGTNDAPQLKEADVGFSMGIAGTEVAKEASDIILLDDNFTSIVKAVQWGRNVFDSIRKFVQFQLTVNVVAVTIAFVGAVANGESPLKPVQMLWVNLIMDTLAALALATEAPTPELLKRKPYGRFEGIITPAMWRNIIGQALYQIIVLFVLLYQAHNIPHFGLPSEPLSWTSRDHVVHTTIIFNSFVLCQLFNEFNARKLGNEFNVISGFSKNIIFVVILVFTVAVQYLIVQFGGEFTETAPLTKRQWLACIAIGLFSLPWGAFLRLIPVPTSGTQVYAELRAPAPDVEIREAKQSNLRFRTAGQKIIKTNSVLQGLRRRSTLNKF